jgi:site-specific recombinase XerD
MTLHDAIEQYIVWRRAHGAKLDSSAGILRRFLRYADGNAACDAVTTTQVLAFLAGEGPLTRLRENKYYALNGFWRHAISRGLATRSPLPENEPKSPPRNPPYIYSHEELRRLFEPANLEVCRRGAVQLDARTFRALILLLYGAGLRFSEATGLTLADVDLPAAVLTIRATKFYKSRLVPIGPLLAKALANDMPLRRVDGRAENETSFFLANRDGTRIASSTAQDAFNKLRHLTGMDGADRGQRVPRLHDLRHSFAVHNLTAWYRRGADVHRLLPALSTYLGHSDLEGTKVYLSMTPELLQQASRRFACYVGGGQDA